MKQFDFFLAETQINRFLALCHMPLYLQITGKRIPFRDQGFAESEIENRGGEGVQRKLAGDEPKSIEIEVQS